MKDWTIEPPDRTGVNERLARCARMEALEGGSDGEACDRVVRTIATRLTASYPHTALTRVPAVAAASLLKRRWDTLDHGEDAADTPGDAICSDLPDVRAPSFKVPSFCKRVTEPEPTLRGTWTHAFLQHLDLSGPCDVSDFEAQLRDKVEVGLFSPTEAAEIDTAAIAWFFSETELGRRMRTPHTRVLREWPFVLGAKPTRYDPSAVPADGDDLMLVRGIIDVLFDDGDGWQLLDYKTDSVSAAGVPVRAASYHGQLDIYAQAVSAVWPGHPRRGWLVFLSPRRVVEVGLSIPF